MEETNDVVHPEVRAHISSLVSALGGVDEDGQYQLGDDALDVLRDMKKWIRYYDQKLNRMDVARCLAETNLVGGDLLRILATWPENGTTQRFKARVALACLEILTPLTWPLERDPETTTVNHYRHLPVLQLAQLAYKRAIINFDSTPVLHTAVRVALPSLAVPLGDRTLRDQGIIKLVLFFLRNVAMIEPDSRSSSSSSSSDDALQVGRSATIDAFAYQDILLLLLTLASNMGEDFRSEDAAALEILFHLVKGVAVDRLFMDAAARQQSQADELAGLLHQEAALLQAAQPRAPTRHSRFGTMVWVAREGGRMSTLSGQAALVGAAARERQMDASKKFRPPQRGRRQRRHGANGGGGGEERQEMAGLFTPVVLNTRASGQLRQFVNDFLDAGFNPLFQHVRRSIDREAPHVLAYHRAQFLYLVAWFLEAARVRGASQADADVTPFHLVAGVLNQEMFIFLGRALDRAYADKDWQELTVVMRCYTQILLTVQAMSTSARDEDEEIAENILSRLFYEEATHDAIAQIAKTYKDQGFDYLDACTELAHTYLRILEAYAKQNVDLQVRSRRRTRKKKAQSAGKEGDAGGDESDEANDEARAQQTSTERKFDFQKVATRFAAQGVIDTFVRFTQHFPDLSDAQLKRAHRFLYRIAFKQHMSVMLFRVDILRLLHTMVQGDGGGTAALDKSRPGYADWAELAKQLFRRCVRKIEERPVLIIEMLFSKSASTAHFLEYGYEKQTVAAAGPARPAAALVFRRDNLDRDTQIAIAVSVLLDRNQHGLLHWAKTQLAAAEAERRSWQLAAAVEAAKALEADGTAFPSSEATPYIIHPEDDACRKAMFKNAHLRLLMQLIDFERLTPGVEETPDAVWVVPASKTADQLKASLDLIHRAEFAPPVFGNDESAEDQLRRQVPARKKAVYDDDGDAAGDAAMDDAMLFPAGGPTARKATDARPKTRRRRLRHRETEAGSGSGSEAEGPTEAELDERARQRRQKELEKARRIKSDLYVHASDDETDDEKDAAFFAREEAIRQRVHKSVLGAARAAEAEPAKRKAPPDSMDVSDDDSAVPTQETARKRRRSASHDTASVADEDRVPARAVRRHAGFEDSSDEEQDMTDDTPLSSPHKGDEVDDDDDDVVPVAKRRIRAKGGFVLDSDDE